MAHFDYSAPAELFGKKHYQGGPYPVRYRRFSSGAEALQFAVEQVPAPLLVGLVLECEENRFDQAEIHELYESPAYPLDRA
jgi:hypothetical protein